MKCPQCEGVVRFTDRISGMTRYVECGNCLYKAPVGTYIANLSYGRFAVEHDEYNHYKVVDAEGVLCKLIIDPYSPRKVEFNIEAEKPSKLKDFIKFLRDHFENVEISVEQTGIDPDYAGCPLCGCEDLKRRRASDWTLYCPGHFQVKLSTLTASVVANYGLVITNHSDFAFDMRYDRPAPRMFWQEPKLERDLIAQVRFRYDDRKTVVAVTSVAPDKLNLIFSMILERMQARIKFHKIEVIQVKKLT